MEFAPAEKRLKELIMDDASSRNQIQKAVEQLEDPNAYDEYNGEEYCRPVTFSLLMYASKFERDDVMEILLDKRPDLDITSKNGTGATVLRMCAKRGQLDMAKMLYKKVPKEKRHNFINSRNNNGWTPLHAACENENYRFPQWLLLNGAEPSPRMDDSNWTPMHCAAKKKNIQIFNLLRCRGADLGIEADIAYHREFGKVTPFGLLKHCLENTNDEYNASTKKLTSKAFEIKEGRKHLKALVVILMVHNKDKDYGAQKASPEIRDIFEENVECDIFPVAENGNLSKKDLPVIIRRVRRKMQTGEYGLLFWLISSHGGTDSAGSFFQDSDLKKIHVFPDIINQFSVDKSATMEGKYAYYFLDYCRMYGESSGDNSGMSLRGNITDHGNYAIVYTSCDGEPALHEGEGPRASLAFAQVLRRQDLERHSIRQLINIASKSLRDEMFRIGDSQGSESFYTQSMAVLDHICDDIGFMPKRASTKQ